MPLSDAFPYFSNHHRNARVLIRPPPVAPRHPHREWTSPHPRSDRRANQISLRILNRARRGSSFFFGHRRRPENHIPRQEDMHPGFRSGAFLMHNEDEPRRLNHSRSHNYFPRGLRRLNGNNHDYDAHSRAELDVRPLGANTISSATSAASTCSFRSYAADTDAACPASFCPRLMRRGLR
jgi:hypothetical protein